MKNQRGHWVFWMPTGRKNGLMWRIHTAADVNARCVSTAEGTRRGLHTQPPEPRSNFTAWTQQVCRRNVRAKEEVWQGCRSYNIFTILYTYPGITWNAKLCRSERGAGRFPLRNPESWLLLTTITWRGSERYHEFHTKLLGCLRYTQFCWVGKHYYYETDEFPYPRPSQPKTN